MSSETEIRAFLQAIPQDILLSEAGKIMAARRSPDRARRSKKLKPCRFCGKPFGGRDMRSHLAASHPGGIKSGHQLLKTKPEVIRLCKHCGEPFGYLAMRKHVHDDHPEKRKVRNRLKKGNL